MKLNKYMLLAVAATAIVGCKGKDDNNSGSKPYVETPIEVMTALSNNQWQGVRTHFEYPLDVFDDYVDENNSTVHFVGDEYYCGSSYDAEVGIMTICAEDPNNPPTKGVMTRYAATKQDPIKVYFNYPEGYDGSPVPQEILDGISMIESAIGRSGIFTVDLATGEMPYSEISLLDNNEHDAARVRYQSFQDENGDLVKGGIIFSWGTGYGSGLTCGNVASSFRTGELSGRVVNSDNEFVTDKGFKWVNLGNEEQGCGVTAELVAHELGHALGFGTFGYGTFADPQSARDENHFNGFGWDGAWDKRAQNILHIMYNIPTGTPLDEIEELINTEFSHLL